MISILTVKEAATHLRVSMALVYELCSTGKLRHERHGLGRGTIRIPEDAIDEYRRAVTVDAIVVTKRRYKHLK